MQIKSITYETLKGLSETIEIGQRTLLLGPNGSGKTTRLLGPSFAVTGHTPFGREPKAAMALGDHQGVGVAVVLDDGFGWSRRVKRDPEKGSASMTLAVRGHERLNNKDAAELIHGHVGNFAPMFDMGAFLGLSPEARRNFVLGLCAGGTEGEAELDKEALCRQIALAFLEAELGKGMVATIRETEPDVCVASQLLCSKLAQERREAFHLAHMQIGKELTGDLPTAIGAALDKAKELANASKRASEQARQAATRLADRKNEIETVALSLEALKQKRTELTERRVELAGEIGKQAGHESARSQHQAAIERLTRETTELQDTFASLPVLNIEEQQAKADELERRAATLEQTPAPSRDDLQASIDAAEEAMSASLAATDAVADAKATAAQARSNVLSLVSQVEGAKADPWIKALGLISEIDQKIILDTRHALQDEWVCLVKLIRTQADAPKLKTLLANLEEAKKQVVHWDEVLRLAVESETTAKNISELADTAMQAAAKEFKKAELDHAMAVSEVNELRRQAEQIRRNIEQRNETVERLNKQMAAKNDERIEHERALQDEQTGETAPSDVDLPALLDAVTSQLAHLEAQIQARSQYDVLLAELNRCHVQAEQERVAHAVCKQLANAIRTLREELMAKLIAPLLDRMRNFLRTAVGTRCAPYCELTSPTGKPSFELGWVMDDRRVPLDSLSGGENVLYCAALAYAMVDLADPPLKLLLLECGEVDHAGLLRLLTAITASTGKGWQVMITSHLERLSLTVGEDNQWDVVTLSKAASEARAPSAAKEISPFPATPSAVPALVSAKQQQQQSAGVRRHLGW